MKIVRPTADLEVTASGPMGYAAIVVDAHTPRTGPVRIVLDLTPQQCLELAITLIRILAAPVTYSRPEGA